MAAHSETQGATNWGRWGEDDERGALNLLTPKVLKTAAASVKIGRFYPLGIPIQAEGVPLYDYRAKPMRLTLEDSTDEGIYEEYGCKPGTGAHEDVVVFASHTTSHMDALIHVYEDGKHYNGVPSTAMRAMAGATKLGIEKCGGFASRGVLLDMPRYFGDPKWVEPGRNITGDDLAGACAAQGVEVQAGDVVLARTGYLQKWFEEQGDQGLAQAGIGLDAAEWLASKDVVAVGSDNAAVEVIPPTRTTSWAYTRFFSSGGASTCSSSSTCQRRRPTRLGKDCWRSPRSRSPGPPGAHQPDLHQLGWPTRSAATPRNETPSVVRNFIRKLTRQFVVMWTRMLSILF
jgi:kynurenine formamidase